MFGTFDGGRTEAFRPRIPPGRGKGWQEIRRDEGNDVGLSLCLSVSLSIRSPEFYCVVEEDGK